MSLIKKSLASVATLTLAMAMAAPTLATTANVNQTTTQDIQNSSGSSVDNTANVLDNAFENASGNIGANVAAGNGNQQANNAYIDYHSPNFVFSGDYEQSSISNDYSDSTGQYASITGQAFKYASGNVNANVAAGNGNQQQNASFIVADDSLNSETIVGSQVSDQNTCTYCDHQQAYINGHAFDHSSGNVGANVAAGNANQQINSMTIAATNASQNNDFEQSTGETDEYGNGNDWDNSGNQLALINDNAFNHATGNLGVNVTAGNGNQQMNRAEILTMDSNGSNSSSLEQEQDGSTSFQGSDLNVANIAQNAFMNASGNIGVNVSAGNGNQQANILTVIP